MEKYIRYFSDLNIFSLKEKLYNIRQDVDFIYNNSFKEIVDDIANNNLKDLSEYCLPNSKDIKIFKSSQLKAKDCKKAHEIIPIDIYCGLYDSSYYNFTKEKKVVVSINQGALDHFVQKINIPDTRSYFRRLKNQVNEDRMKASIAHELTHWIDDSLYQLFHHIVGDETDPKKRDNRLTFRTGLMDTTYYEIQAQIHGIQEIKKAYSSEKWNKLSINDLFELYPPLTDVIDKVRREFNKEIAYSWIRAILKRLDRENLLGKNMMKTLDINKLFEFCIKTDRVY